MAQTSFPFENVDTTEVQFSQWARHINEGIRPDFANELEVFADDSGLNVTVRSGQAMVRGHYYASTAEETLNITTPDETNPRIDSVVLKLDIVANSILLEVVAGTPDASPVAPTLTQSEDGNVYQFLLANVDVAAGVFSIEAGDVTDLRTYMFQGVGKWTTDTRPANPIDYQTIGYNTDLNTHEVWNGSAWTSVFAPITTEGDLAIGDNTGTAVRLPIGAADTVLTSNGTTAVWAETGGGGNELFLEAPFDIFKKATVNLPAGTAHRFALVSTSESFVDLTLEDGSGTVLTTASVSTTNPFTYVNESTDILEIYYLQSVADELAYILITQVDTPTATETINYQIIDTTQSVTLASQHTALLLGGGGGGGGTGNAEYAQAGGGGGSGYQTIGTFSAGTYTATIGAGGTGDRFTGNTGGTTLIGGLSANGGDGGTESIYVNDETSDGGDGGDGGSGGSGGSAGTQFQDTNAVPGGTNGSDGSAGNARGGAAGLGSNVQLANNNTNPLITIIPVGDGGPVGGSGNYAGGAGGETTNVSGAVGENGTGYGAGGQGASGPFNNSGQNFAGGNGADGVIILVED